MSADAATGKASKTGFFATSSDVEGKPLQEDVITQEAASKSVHVLGQGMFKTPVVLILARYYLRRQSRLQLVC